MQLCFSFYFGIKFINYLIEFYVLLFSFLVVNIFIDFLFLIQLKISQLILRLLHMMMSQSQSDLHQFLNIKIQL